MLAVQSVRILTDLHGTNVLLLFELVKGLTRPAATYSVIRLVLEEIVGALVNLVAKWKLNQFLHPHTPTKKAFKPADLVQVHVTQDNEKQGSC